ncbi:MAG: FAD-dependent oxidoreductase [Gammaproteobacteria bacterium]|nr:FAD-dependent oxidoreductase [Gammaproteobacteria bacterium]
MPESTYDIVVIGAGIQGAGVAQAAAACGYKTLVIEKFPEAGLGTSCKSSKLIHGGLRYLESGQFKLVYECLRERKRLVKNAPQLVKLIPFYIPVYSNSMRSSWMIWLGLSIYSLFSFKKFSIVNKSEWESLDGLNLKNLKCIYKYFDAQTDDKKLTQAVIKSAEKQGADILYNSDFKKSDIQESKHIVTYIKDNKEYSTTCLCIVNCTGPWVTPTQEKIKPLLKTPAIDLIAGTHIIVDRPITGGVYYIEAADRRAVFVMPWKAQQTLIGTTERHYSGNADNLKPDETEKRYLLETYNSYFSYQLTTDNIIESFAGLRVLPQNNQSTFNKSRESLIITNAKLPGLITIIGGKLTAYRASSEDVLMKLKDIMGPPEQQKNCDTRNIKL